MGAGYLYRTQGEAPTVPCACGQSTRILTWEDSPVANLHVTHITDSVKHFHKECTECYYILAGNGTMEVGDDEVDLYPGVTILIEPGTPHRAFGDVTTVVLGVPSWRPDDEYFVNDDAGGCDSPGRAATETGAID